MHQILIILHTGKIMKILILSIISLFFLSCDFKKPPIEQDLDLIYDKATIYSDESTKPPYSSPKFKSVLNQANYQFPHSVTIARLAAYGDFKTDAFYLDEKGDLYFSLRKDYEKVKERSEIRQVCINSETGKRDTDVGWKTSEANGNFWVSEIRCFKPYETQSYTWMQVHGIDGTDITLNDGTIVKSFNYPIIRLTWERYRDGVYDHNWAIIITSYPRTPKTYEWVDLGPRQDDFFKAEVHFQNNIMKVIIDDIVMSSHDVTYWEEEPNYFKAGIYINRFDDGGRAVIAYRTLRFDNNDSLITHY